MPRPIEEPREGISLSRDSTVFFPGAMLGSSEGMAPRLRAIPAIASISPLT